MAIDGVNRNDMKLVEATLRSIQVERPAPTKGKPQGMCMDKGYNYDAVRRTVVEFGFTAHIKTRGEECRAIKKAARLKARRWAMERTTVGLIDPGACRSIALILPR